MKINAGMFLTQRAMLNPGQTGLVCAGRSYTFLEMNRRANRLAHALAALGVRHGDRVGILGLNGVEYNDLFFGLAKLGAVLVPINYRLAAPELSSILLDSGTRVLVHDPDFEELIAQARGPVPPFLAVRTGPGSGPGLRYDDLLDRASDAEPIVSAGDDHELAILYTVWATGRPKGVALTHENFFWTAVTTMATLPRLGPVFLLPLALFHVGGLAWLPVCMHLGMRCVLLPRFAADPFLDLIQGQGVTSVGVVPTMLYFLRDSPRFAQTDFSRLRSILSYGSATPASLIEDCHQSGLEIQQLYGLTECGGPALVVDAEHSLSKAGSCGLPFFYTRVKLVDDAGSEAAPGGTGEVIISSPNVMKGYWNQPEATRDALRGEWLYTGDVGRQDEDGYFYIVDRKKELIISGGENIFPGEVERVLFAHPGVADVAVMGAPDQVFGELCQAVVVKKPEAALSEKDLTKWCRDKLALYKIPRRVLFVDTLPRTLTGKMQKNKLRELLKENRSG